jgi:hypothetical protein
VEDHAYCFSCPGLSQLRTGDPMQVDDQYLRIAKIRSSVAKESHGCGSLGANKVSIRSETLTRS